MIGAGAGVTAGSGSSPPNHLSAFDSGEVATSTGAMGTIGAVGTTCCGAMTTGSSPPNQLPAFAAGEDATILGVVGTTCCGATTTTFGCFRKAPNRQRNRQNRGP